jgi:hypothetical protein
VYHNTSRRGIQPILRISAGNLLPIFQQIVSFSAFFRRSSSAAGYETGRLAAKI